MVAEERNETISVERNLNEKCLLNSHTFRRLTSAAFFLLLLFHFQFHLLSSVPFRYHFMQFTGRCCRIVAFFLHFFRRLQPCRRMPFARVVFSAFAYFFFIGIHDTRRYMRCDAVEYNLLAPHAVTYSFVSTHSAFGYVWCGKGEEVAIERRGETKWHSKVIWQYHLLSATGWRVGVKAPLWQWRWCSCFWYFFYFTETFTFTSWHCSFFFGSQNGIKRRPILCSLSSIILILNEDNKNVASSVDGVGVDDIAPWSAQRSTAHARNRF